MTDTDQLKRTPIFPIWVNSPETRFVVSVASELDPDDPWSGWTDVDADARRKAVELDGVEYTPEEARYLAQALSLAAGHAESYFGDLAATLDYLADESPSMTVELAALPDATAKTVRDTIRAAANRFGDQDPLRGGETA